MSGIGPGDVVVCVDDGWIECETFFHRGNDGLAVGRIYRIGRIAIDPECGCPTAYFAGGKGIVARFRKLNDEPDKAEIVTRIKRCRPAKQQQIAA